VALKINTMIKLSEILNEDNPCWKGYKVGDPKTKISSRTGKRVNNCVPINELSLNSNDVREFLEYAEKQKYPFLDYGSFKILKSDVLEDNGSLFNELRQELENIDPNWRDKVSNVNEAFFIGEDDIDEYDVENEQDIKEFIEFMREYQQQLNEADCDCLLEAKYQGRTVPLGKPMRGDSKKFKVYVKNPKTGKVIKVNFGAKGMNIKKNNPKRRKAFRARHNCANPGPRTKARYWSCRKW